MACLNAANEPVAEEISYRINNTPPRCVLPIVKFTFAHEKKRIAATMLLDSGSELNVMSSKLCKRLGLAGVSFSINIVGVAGEVPQIKTKLVEVVVKDRMCNQTPLQCILHVEKL